MEFKRALYQFKQDSWAIGSLLFIIIVTLIAIFAYFLAPDKTAYGNQMHLSIHSQPPGFSCEMLIIPQKKRKKSYLFLSGNNNPNEEIPVQDIKWFKDGLAYKRYGNATDYYEKIFFSSFLGDANKSVIKSNYLIKKQFILGTDKYGRDLLSRLLIGSRISISIGFVAVLYR